jgi:hypothetical protein
MTLALIIFCSISTYIFSTLALVASRPSLVLWQTLCWELLAYIFLQIFRQIDAKKITPTKLDPVSSRNFLAL